MRGVFSFEQLCRLCATYRSGSLTLNSFDSDSILLLDKLKTVAPRILDCNNKLPEVICMTCTIRLNEAYTFVKQCFESQDLLKNRLSEPKVKLEDMNNSLKTEIESIYIKEETFSDSESIEANIQNEEGNYDFACLNVETELVEENEAQSQSSGTSDLYAALNINLADKERRYKCDTCGKAFFTKLDLKIHIRVHTNEKPYVCKVCGKGFSQRPNLKRHVRTHTNEKHYKCEICNRAFSENGNLQNHINSVHINERPFKCQVCEKTFNRNTHLRGHMRIHTNEKPYTCEHCGKTFAHSSHMSRHIRSHTNERPYKCSVCEKAFIRKSCLDVHMRTHTNEKPFKCHLCERAFTQKPPLQNHIRSVHSKEISKSDKNKSDDNA